MRPVCVGTGVFEFVVEISFLSYGYGFDLGGEERRFGSAGRAPEICDVRGMRSDENENL